MREVVVQKFGGSSLKSIQSIESIALIIKREFKKGSKVLVVVSAMYGFTDELLSHIRELHVPEYEEENSMRERDVVTSSGEQISAGLLVMALNKLHIKAKSLMGWQIPINTSNNHCSAFINDIGTLKIESLLRDGYIPVVAGFQGVSDFGDIFTLGRGGSDTTAVAIAAAIKADRCDIYTDVDGVYTLDPSSSIQGEKISTLDYRSMLEISLYAQVLNGRAVEIAQKNLIPLRILSSYEQGNSCTRIINSVSTFHKVVIVHSKEYVALAVSIDEGDIILSKVSFPVKMIFIFEEKLFLMCSSQYTCLLLGLSGRLPDKFVVIDLISSKLCANIVRDIIEIREQLSKLSIDIVHILFYGIKVSVVVRYCHLDKALNILHKIFILDIEKAL